MVPGEDYKIRFKIVDKTGKRPNLVLKDVGVLVFLSPGIWQQRQVARPAGDGVYGVTVNVPDSGVYLVFIESPVAAGSVPANASSDPARDAGPQSKMSQ